MFQVSCMGKILVPRYSLVEAARHRRILSLASITTLSGEARRRMLLFSDDQRPDSVQGGVHAPYYLQGKPESSCRSTRGFQAGTPHHFQKDQDEGAQRRQEQRARRAGVLEGDRSA